MKHEHCTHYSDGYERCCLCDYIASDDSVYSEYDYELMHIKDLEREVDDSRKTDD